MSNSQPQEETFAGPGPGEGGGETATATTSRESRANVSLHANVSMEDPAPQPPPPLKEGPPLPPAGGSSELTVTPSDLSAMEEPATQPKLATFPTTVIDRKLRSFNGNWYEKFKWIEYSKARDAIFCKACRHFPEMHTEFTFIRDG